jgi:hypothetical protein
LELKGGDSGVLVSDLCRILDRGFREFTLAEVQ